MGRNSIGVILFAAVVVFSIAFLSRGTNGAIERRVSSLEYYLSRMDNEGLVHTEIMDYDRWGYYTKAGGVIPDDPFEKRDLGKDVCRVDCRIPTLHAWNTGDMLPCVTKEGDVYQIWADSNGESKWPGWFYKKNGIQPGVSNDIIMPLYLYEKNKGE